jgi:hypothetical protein
VSVAADTIGWKVSSLVVREGVLCFTPVTSSQEQMWFGVRATSGPPGFYAYRNRELTWQRFPLMLRRESSLVQLEVRLSELQAYPAYDEWQGLAQEVVAVHIPRQCFMPGCGQVVKDDELYLAMDGDRIVRRCAAHGGGKPLMWVEQELGIAVQGVAVPQPAP